MQESVCCAACRTLRLTTTTAPTSFTGAGGMTPKDKPVMPNRYAEAGELEARADRMMRTAASMHGDAMRLYTRAAAIREASG